MSGDALRILVGDCRQSLQSLPEQSAQCCITSPPYFGLRDYGMAGQLGLEPTPEAYVAAMVDVFRAVRRVLRDDGTLWVNIGDSYANTGKSGGGAQGERWAKAGGRTNDCKGTFKYAPPGYKPKDLMGVPWMLAFALRADGWYLRADIVWHKRAPMPESVRDRPTRAHELVFLLTKRPTYFYDADAVREPSNPAHSAHHDRYKSRLNTSPRNPDRNDGGGATQGGVGYNPAGRNKRDVWTLGPEPYRGAHFAVMPTKLVEPCVRAGTSERGACPHCGAPWVRQTERTVHGRPKVCPGDEGAWQTRRAGAGRDMTDDPLANSGLHSQYLDVRRETIGWIPSCACPAHEPVPCVVLDPFGGSGTVAGVALALGRAAVLCELNPAYAA
ncbi:MAG TPA: site-specific DNA-methyltransferase, partial [Gaiellaceae bacterium]